MLGKQGSPWLGRGTRGQRTRSTCPLRWQAACCPTCGQAHQRSSSRAGRLRASRLPGALLLRC
jgi:hypothetical protein